MAHPPGGRAYGTGFSSGFFKFKTTGDFADVVVTIRGREGEPFRLHGLLLANRSEFFLKALTGDFVESQQKRVELTMDPVLQEVAWPALVDYFYTDCVTVTDANVFPLLALSRQLLVPAVDGFCRDYLARGLCLDTCVSYLAECVRHGLDDLQADCVCLLAKSFHLLYDDAGTAGLPHSAVLEVLSHPDLQVHCELQVLTFVLKYVSSTQLEPAALGAVCAHVRFPYLDNATLSELASGGGPKGLLPRDLVYQGGLARLGAIDRGESAIAELLVPPPRPTYCCNPAYQLPGGLPYVDVSLDDVWEELCRDIVVRVSGCSEGSPRNVLSAEPEAWFETDDSADPPGPWLELVMPPNVTVTHTSRYTWSHGHRRSGYFRLRNFKTMVAESCGGGANGGGSSPLLDLATRVTEQFEVTVVPPGRPWQVLRIQSTGSQEDGVHRLCVRNLRVSGVCRIDLMAQAGQGHHALRPHQVLKPVLAVPPPLPGAVGSASSPGGCYHQRSSTSGAVPSGSSNGSPLSLLSTMSLLSLSGGGGTTGGDDTDVATAAVGGGPPLRPQQAAARLAGGGSPGPNVSPIYGAGVGDTD